MAAVTSITIVARQVLGGAGRSCIADVTFSSNYAAGGDTYTNAQFGMTTVQAIIPLGAANASSSTGFAVVVDLANKKLRLQGGAASGVVLAENSTADQHLTTVRVLVIGDFPYI